MSAPVGWSCCLPYEMRAPLFGGDGESFARFETICFAEPVSQARTIFVFVSFQVNHVCPTPVFFFLGTLRRLLLSDVPRRAFL